MTLVAGSRVIRAGMVVQLVTVKQERKERNVAILKVIEKDGVLKLLSEQLQKVQAELEQVRASQEQDTTATRDALRKSEAISEKGIGDVAKLGRTLSSVMVMLRVSFGPRTLES
jgi:hypothetical protein